MDTKEYAEKIINNLDDYPFECGYVAEEYLTQCQEVEMLKDEIKQYSDLMFHVGEFLSATTEGHRADAAFEIKHCYLEIEALKDKQ